MQKDGSAHLEAGAVPCPPAAGQGAPGGVAGEGRARVMWGAGDVAWSAVGARLKPTKLTAIISTFLRDQLSGQGSAGERIPLLEVVRFSVALFHLVCYHCIVKCEWFPRLPFTGGGRAVHAVWALPCHSKGCAPEYLQFPVSLALHCQLS